MGRATTASDSRKHSRHDRKRPAGGYYDLTGASCFGFIQQDTCYDAISQQNQNTGAHKLAKHCRSHKLSARVTQAGSRKSLRRNKKPPVRNRNTRRKLRQSRFCRGTEWPFTERGTAGPHARWDTPGVSSTKAGAYGRAGRAHPRNESQVEGMTVQSSRSVSSRCSFVSIFMMRLA